MHLDARRQHLVIKGQSRLDQAGSTGSGFGVTDLRLDGTQSAPGLLCRTINLAQGIHLNGITHPGAGAMPLDQLDGIWCHLGLFVGTQQRFGLPLGTRLVDGSAATVAGSTDPLDHRIDTITVALGIRKAFKDNHPQAFTQGRTVGIIRVGFCVSGWRQGRRFAETGVHEDIVKGIDPTGDHHVRTPGGELQRSQIQRT